MIICVMWMKYKLPCYLILILSIGTCYVHSNVALCNKCVHLHSSDDDEWFILCHYRFGQVNFSTVNLSNYVDERFVKTFTNYLAHNLIHTNGNSK